MNFDAFINEGIYAKYDGINFYRNPPSVKHLNAWVRGIILQNGDLYIGQSDTSFITHSGILIAAAKLDIITEYNNMWHKEYSPTDSLCVQRLDRTGEFYLSESYEYNPKHAKEYMKSAQIKADVYNKELLFYSHEIVANAH